jgi:plasmid stabilization system protein ParE
MDPRERPVKVIVSPIARDELAEIWEWNAKERGVRHADSYLAFLGRSISALSRSYLKGKKVATRPDLQYIQIRRRNRGHGHVAVYTVDDQAVNILHVFHTAQDWQAKVAEE